MSLTKFGQSQDIISSEFFFFSISSFFSSGTPVAHVAELFILSHRPLGRLDFSNYEPVFFRSGGFYWYVFKFIDI